MTFPKPAIVAFVAAFLAGLLRSCHLGVVIFTQ